MRIVLFQTIQFSMSTYKGFDEKENSEFKPVKPCLKIDLVSYPSQAEGVGKYGKVFDKLFQTIQFM